MEETVGIAIAVLVISSFVVCMLVFFFTWASGSLNAYNTKIEQERLRAKREREERELADKRKLENAHKVRSQYPPPSGKVTTFEIANTKDAIIVTETVYAD